MRERKSVIFDIDGTLALAPAGNAWLEITKQLGVSSDKHLELFVNDSNGEISLDYAVAELIKLWRDTGKLSENQISKTMDSIPLRDGAETTVSYPKKAGYELCLITSSPAPFAASVAKRLGIEEYYANDFEWDEDGELAGFSFDPDLGRKKLKQFKEYLKVKSLSAEQCVIVGDGMNDSGLFLETKRGIAIRPTDKEEALNPELEKISWKVIENLSQVETIL